MDCGEPAISLHSHHVSRVQWTTRLLPVMRDPGSIHRRYLCETGILQLALSRYIGDPNVIDHCGLVWGRLCPEPSLGPRANNVIIPLDLTQLFCPGFTLAAGPPFGFTTDIVGCLGEPCGEPTISLHSHHVSLVQWTTVCFPSWGTRVQSPGGYLCETGILLLALSCYRMLFHKNKKHVHLKTRIPQRVGSGSGAGSGNSGSGKKVQTEQTQINVPGK